MTNLELLTKAVKDRLATGSDCRVQFRRRDELFGLQTVVELPSDFDFPVDGRIEDETATGFGDWGSQFRWFGDSNDPEEGIVIVTSP